VFRGRFASAHRNCALGMDSDREPRHGGDVGLEQQSSRRDQGPARAFRLDQGGCARHRDRALESLNAARTHSVAGIADGDPERAPEHEIFGNPAKLFRKLTPDGRLRALSMLDRAAEQAVGTGMQDPRRMVADLHQVTACWVADQRGGESERQCCVADGVGPGGGP